MMRFINTCYVSILQYVSILCTRVKVLPNDAKINIINLINWYINAIIITMVYNFLQPLYTLQQSSSSNILLANRYSKNHALSQQKIDTRATHVPFELYFIMDNPSIPVPRIRRMPGELLKRASELQSGRIKLVGARSH